MDGRAGFAAGGFIVGAAVVAVACAVTLSNSAALADVPGAAVGIDAVHVTPRYAAATPTPQASTPAVIAPEIPGPTASAEVVQAPEPRVITPPAASAPVTQPAPAPPAVTDDSSLSQREIEQDAVRTRSWDRLRAWALANGWATPRVDRWIARLEDQTTRERGSILPRTPADAGDDAGRWSGSKRAQSPQPPHGD
ncbi:hypothetical protein [Microbacterium sp. SS28]|uniref:hypothetical protein n=1 Tax=Microbacterium sp. SS28 TaxID=2919948 RepID=UPI001FAAAD0F|nr:hypothetical protein [Microbacterium sp. SS28]